MNKKNLFFVIVSMAIAMSSCSNTEGDEIVSYRIPSSNIKQYETKLIPIFDSNVTVLDSANYYKFQNDIWIPKYYIDSTNISTRGAAILGRTWPNNRIYYTTDNIPKQYAQNIFEAISLVEQHSYIDFIPTKGGIGYLKFNYEDSKTWDAHSDYLGMRIGSQNIVLSTDAIQNIGVIVHEICHAIGMDHEQNRSDRDNYLTIDFSSMPDNSTKYQYMKYTDKGLAGADIGSFDFGSIMLYSSDKYMKKKDGSYFYGQRDRLSNTDMLTLAALQPLGNDFTFYDPLGYDDGINTDYTYQRSKMLRCPEGANVSFDFQYLNDLDPKKLKQFSYNEFDITAEIKIVDLDNGKINYSRIFQIDQMKSWYTINIPEITLPQGIYKVYVTLQGKSKGDYDQEKENALIKILYSPRIYLKLQKAIINGKSRNIPSEFGNENRLLTFISI